LNQIYGPLALSWFAWTHGSHKLTVLRCTADGSIPSSAWSAACAGHCAPYGDTYCCEHAGMLLPWISAGSQHLEWRNWMTVRCFCLEGFCTWNVSI
jgi:hypothetical protein